MAYLRLNKRNLWRFNLDNTEVNRIVEFPKESLESDILKILNDEDYKHAYFIE